jgi:hypothetical protein
MERGTWTDARLDDRFVHIDARFDQVDARFDRIDARLDVIDGRLADLQLTLVRVVGGGMTVGLLGIAAAILARG